MGSGKNEYRRYAAGGKSDGVAGFQHAKKAVPNTIVSNSAAGSRKDETDSESY